MENLNTCDRMLVLRGTIDLKTKIIVYYALFYSVLQYGIEFWGQNINADKIFKVQDRF